jgi:hypothetical protein
VDNRQGVVVQLAASDLAWEWTFGFPKRRGLQRMSDYQILKVSAAWISLVVTDFSSQVLQRVVTDLPCLLRFNRRHCHGTGLGTGWQTTTWKADLRAGVWTRDLRTRAGVLTTRSDLLVSSWFPAADCSGCGRDRVSPLPHTKLPFLGNLLAVYLSPLPHYRVWQGSSQMHIVHTVYGACAVPFAEECSNQPLP